MYQLFLCTDLEKCHFCINEAACGFVKISRFCLLLLKSTFLSSLPENNAHWHCTHTYLVSILYRKFRVTPPPPPAAQKKHHCGQMCTMHNQSDNDWWSQASDGCSSIIRLSISHRVGTICNLSAIFQPLTWRNSLAATLQPSSTWKSDWKLIDQISKYLWCLLVAFHEKITDAHLTHTHEDKIGKRNMNDPELHE